MTEPDKHPIVRNMKYKLVAKEASASDISTRSINILGAVVFIPTSRPTWQTIPTKHISMPLSVSNLNVEPIFATCVVGVVSVMCVKPKMIMATTDIVI